MSEKSKKSNTWRNLAAIGALIALEAVVLRNQFVEDAPRENAVQTALEKENPRENGANGNRAFAEYTSGWEGRRNEVYDPIPEDGRPEPTIGVGHYLDRADSRETFARVLPGVDWDSVREGRTRLTDEQVNTLFEEDIQEYIDRTRDRIDNFDNLPEYLQVALVDGTYRGDLGPRTRDLINEGNWEGAATEYLNHEGYRSAVERGLAGIRTRMNSNSGRMLRYAEELEER